MTTYVEQAILDAAQGNIAYAVRCNITNNIVGTTRFYLVDNNNKRALLGYTLYSSAVRKTSVNTECKLLLLNYLFETHGAIAVEFRTHFFNQAPRAAITRLGAKQDGTLRNHQVMR